MVCGVFCHPVGTVVVSTARVRSTCTVRVGVQPDWLPALSTTWVCIECVPSGMGTLELLAPDCTSPPSRRHSTCPISERGSLPLTTTEVGLYCQPLGTTVVSVGLPRSILMMSVRGAERLCAASSMTVVSVWSASPLTFTSIADAPDAPLPDTPSSVHSTWSMEDTLSLPVTGTTTSALIQPLGGVVSFAGGDVSTLIVSLIHAVAVPSLATARGLRTWLPFVATATGTGSLGGTV